MAVAIKSDLDETGFPIWQEWSRHSESFNERDSLATWRGICPDGGITIATQFHEARKYG